MLSGGEHWEGPAPRYRDVGFRLGKIKLEVASNESNDRVAATPAARGERAGWKLGNARSQKAKSQASVCRSLWHPITPAGHQLAQMAWQNLKAPCSKSEGSPTKEIETYVEKYK